MRLPIWTLFLAASFALASAKAKDASFGAERAKLASFKIESLSRATGQQIWSGTGFFVQGSQFAITNNHVAADAAARPDYTELVAVMPDGSRRHVAVIHVEMALDLAALEVEGPAPKERLELRESPAQLGERVAGAGFGADREFSLSQGLVAAKIGEGSLAPRLQLSTATEGGVSGGPALDESGRVIGVNVAGEGRSLSFAIPSPETALFLNRARAAELAGASWRSISAQRAQGLYGAQLAQASKQTMAALWADPKRVATLGSWRVGTPSGDGWSCSHSDPEFLGGERDPKPWQGRSQGFSCMRRSAPMSAGQHSFGGRWSYTVTTMEPRAKGSIALWRSWASSVNFSHSGKQCSLSRFASAGATDGYAQACVAPLLGMPGLWQGSMTISTMGPSQREALTIGLSFEGLDANGLAQASAWLADQTKLAGPPGVLAKK